VVSQDLELWLTNVVVEDGFNLLARAGRQAGGSLRTSIGPTLNRRNPELRPFISYKGMGICSNHGLYM
jgi:hypothetical protein